MVHEGFTVLNGRTVLVRTDDLAPQEQKDVSAFFATVQHIAANAGTAAMGGTFLGFLAGISGLIGGIIARSSSAGRDVTFAESVALLLAAMLTSVLIGAVCWLAIGPREERKHAELLGEIERLCARSERCRIASSQLRGMSEYHAKILGAPATATAG